jgi:tetratricopeptide (TPR) repeat protein
LLASDPKASVSQTRQLLKAAPADPSLLRLLGAGLRKLGKAEAAQQAEQEAITASLRSPGHRQAAKAVAAGDTARANAILKRLLAEDDTDVVALVMLGLQSSLAKETDTADALLGRAVSLAPADPAARLALAEHFHRSRRAAKALEQLEQLTGEEAQSVTSLSLRAHVLRDLGLIDQEVEILKRLQEAEGGDRYQIRLGHALRTLGRADEAAAAYRRVLANRPEEGTAWWSLANLKTTKFSDHDIATMQRSVDLQRLPAINRIRLNFALGRAFEDRSDPEAAFRHYAEGNRFRQSTATYKPEKTSAWVKRSIALYTPQFYAERKGVGCRARDPIFIIGLQRSGSTLVEQILASHPQVEGTAELRDLPNLIRETAGVAARRNLSLGEYLTKLDAGKWKDLGQAYLDATRVHRKQGRPLFTDKLPNNWQYAPLIPLILPNAKVVDVRRHPLACGFSNWKQLYGSGLEHSYSMEWMGRYYADYVRLMRHVDQVRPGAVHRVIYERLVDDVEGEARRLLDYLGIGFDDAVLDFHRTDRLVRTISAGQVRQPMNRKGVEQWKQYEQWLGPLKQALGPVLEDWEA